jgi:hypothetical protein
MPVSNIKPDRILGVSGTLETLGKVEKDIHLG